MSETVNTNYKPILVSLSTRNSSIKSSDLSTAEWSIKDSISINSVTQAAKVTLKSMRFVNAFQNVIKGRNIIKVCSTYLNGSGLPEKRMITIEVPPGVYSSDTLLQFLNVNVNWRYDYNNIGNPLLDYTDYYGFGVTDLDGETVLEEAFIIDPTDATKIRLQGIPSTAGDLADQYLKWDNTSTGPDPNTTDGKRPKHTGFFLIFDVETLPFLEQIGIVSYDYYGNVNDLLLIPNTSPQLKGFGFSVIYNATDDPLNPYFEYISDEDYVDGTYNARDCFNLLGAMSLSVSLDSISTNVRNSYNSLSISDVLAVVPINVERGYLCNYEPASPFNCVVSSLYFNTLKLSVKDSATGDRVDFQGLDWEACIAIEFLEVDNTTKSSQDMSQNKVIMPLFHGENPDHNRAYSGYTR